MSEASLIRRYEFAAAHRLHSDALSDSENRRVYGKCNNPNGHGHNYVLYITVSGAIRPETGTVTELDALDQVVRDTVVARFDHQDLNHDADFAKTPTTGENLVQLIWDLLVDRIPTGRLEKVGIVETRDNYFEYCGPSVRR
jgi:6-pyruvoyltetrahydropterin/6-carboxytetrahydropterin synthase